MSGIFISIAYITQTYYQFYLLVVIFQEKFSRRVQRSKIINSYYYLINKFC